MATISELTKLRQARSILVDESPQPKRQPQDGASEITCDIIEEKFGPDYVLVLMRLTDNELDQVMQACRDTLQPTGPGRRFRDILARVIVYLTWLESGTTYQKLATLFGMMRQSVARTIDYVMAGLTDSLKAAFIPEAVEDVNVHKHFRHFSAALGAVGQRG